MKRLLSHLDDIMTLAGLAAYGVGLYGLSENIFVPITFIGLMAFILGLAMAAKG